ncbi:MAG: deoxynucleoside kinase [Bacteroidetes bacterium]|nr:deoxynucleoside kinase [Bacteroidota bacterium]
MNPKSSYNFIVIEGNIGAGKTTLATKMAEEKNAQLILEQFAENPFLPKFYAEPEKHAFPLELSFLAERYHQLKKELSNQDIFKNGIIADYYFVKSLIFAKSNLKEDEFGLYTKLFHIIHDSLPKPDILVYLYHDIDRLQQNIKKRGRIYEQNITDDYLIKIQTGYFEFLKQLPEQRILIMDINKLDYANNSRDYKRVVQAIEQDYPLGITHLKLEERE